MGATTTSPTGDRSALRRRHRAVPDRHDATGCRSRSPRPSPTATPSTTSPSTRRPTRPSPDLPRGRPLVAGPGHRRRQGNRLAWSETRKLVKATPATNLDPTTARRRSTRAVDPGAFPAYNSHRRRAAPSSSGPPRTSTSPGRSRSTRTTTPRCRRATGCLQTTSKQAAFVPLAALPPSSEPYRWRVRRTTSPAGARAGGPTSAGSASTRCRSPDQPRRGCGARPNGDASPGRRTRRAAPRPRSTRSTSRRPTRASPIRRVATAASWALPENLATAPTRGPSRPTTQRQRDRLSPSRTFTVDTALGAVTPTRIQAPTGRRSARRSPARRRRGTRPMCR